MPRIVKMTPHDNFKSTVEQIFEWTVETNPSNFRKSEKHLRNDFYEHVYVAREHEESAFGRFLHGEKNILVLTGHVGIGKSTFLRHQLEHQKTCTGVIVDFNRWAKKFANADFGHALRATIARCFRQRLTENIAYYQRRNLPVSFDINYSDKVVEIQSKRHDEERANVSWENAQITLATMILENSCHIAGPEVEAMRKIYGAGVSFGTTAERLDQYRENIVKANQVTACSEIFQVTRYYDWIRLYQIIFKPQVPLLVAFDNADNLNLLSIKTSLFEEIARVHGELNIVEDASLIVGNFLSNIRLVVSIRDENASVLRVHGQPASRTMQIALGMEDYRIPTVAENYELPTTKKFMASVIKKRYLRVANTIGIDDKCLSYFRSLINYWYSPNVESGELEDSVARIGVVELGNYSVRWVLDDIKYTCLYTLDACIDDDIKVEQLNKSGSKPWLRGRIIRSLWSRPSMQSFTRILQNDFRQKCSKPYLSRARLILTFLKRMEEWGREISTTTRDVYTAIRYYFPDVSLDETKKNLHALYESNIRQGELITIRQQTLINSFADIAEEAEIAIMPRGSEMLQKVLINLDYFGGMLPPDTIVPVRRGIRKVFAEMMPDEACLYVESIMNKIIRRVADNYEMCWRDQIESRIYRDNLVPVGTCYFEKFLRDMFVLSGQLYIIRVCDSHIQAIRNYIINCMQGRASTLFLNDENLQKLEQISCKVRSSWPSAESDRLREKVTRASSGRLIPNDVLMEEFLAGIGEEHPFTRIWATAREMRTIMKRFSEITSLRKLQPKLSVNRRG